MNRLASPAQLRASFFRWALFLVPLIVLLGFLSGQVGTDSTGRLVSGGIQAETRQTMNNIRDVLARAGSSLKCWNAIAPISAIACTSIGENSSTAPTTMATCAS